MTAVGCEPRVDYSTCDEAYRTTCPVFYGIVLIAQLIVFLCSGYSLGWDALKALRRPKAPHKPTPLRRRLENAMQHLARDTVLQLRMGTLAFSFSAVVHHGSLLRPSPALHPLLVEVSYNLYNIFLVATIATTLRYWQEFARNAETISGVASERLRFCDTLLLQVFTPLGCCCFIMFTSSFCLATDTWGLLSNSVSSWRLAVKMQHFQFAVVCSIIAISFLRIGKLQETYINRLLTSNYDLVQGDEALGRTMTIYCVLFRLAYALNGLVWIACFIFCGLGGVFFDEFYQLALWLLLSGVFNAVGCFFAGVSFLLSSAFAREAELRLHDLLSYCRDASTREKNLIMQGQDQCIDMEEMEKKKSNFKSKGARATISSMLGQLFNAKDYPCYVMSLSNLQRYSRLPIHEQALHDGTLTILTKSSYWPCRSYCFFVSQVWLSKSHPDGEDDSGNPKLKWFQTVAPSLLGGASRAGDIFVWMDIFSIPQRSKEYQLKALQSLPSFAFLTGDFIPLVPNADAVKAYLRRGWCQVECACALTPKLTQLGQWRTGPFPTHRRFRYYDVSADDSERFFTFETLKNPGDRNNCDFTVESDRSVVMAILATFAKIMKLYEASGSTSWQHTYAIEKRPDWLKALAALEDDVIILI
mmetsp:Transcript_48056/g.104651  ORF Transcript_48056/g.104651 Transcript_48056/m.104651 type:complete len:643 (-) Transcript_48056:465-2393(-)